MNMSNIYNIFYDAILHSYLQKTYDELDGEKNSIVKL